MKRITAYIVILLIITALPLTVSAQKTTLTTVVPSSHLLHLELAGEGAIVVDGVAYTQSADIQIQRKSIPKISLQITDGNKVKSVLWGSEDITEAIRKGSWTMPEVIEDVSLSVTFEKISGTPQTGDTSHLGLWFSLLLFSMFGLIVCLLIRKKKCA